MFYRALMVLICFIVIFVVITLVFFLEPLQKVNYLAVSVQGNFDPIVFKGLGKYFILNRNDSKIIILDTMNHIISIPDANSIISIFGVRLWKKKNNFGVPITMYPIEEKANIIWGENSVSFTHFNSRFEVQY